MAEKCSLRRTRIEEQFTEEEETNVKFTSYDCENDAVWKCPVDKCSRFVCNDCLWRVVEECKRNGCGFRQCNRHGLVCIKCRTLI